MALFPLAGGLITHRCYHTCRYSQARLTQRAFYLMGTTLKRVARMQTTQPTLELLRTEAVYRNDPSAIFHQLCGARPATLLLESAEIDSKENLKSLQTSEQTRQEYTSPIRGSM